MRKYTELDAMRIVACMLVIVSHLVCLVVFDTGFTQWRKANIMYIARDVCVPLFLVITGILKLDSELNYKKQFRKICFFLLIFFLYAWLFMIYRKYNNGSLALTVEELRQCFVEGVEYPSHLWYLPMVIQMYMLLPLLQLLRINDKAMKIFLMLWFWAFILRQDLLQLLKLTQETLPQSLSSVMSSLLNLLPFSELFSYSGYIVLGYYLYHRFQHRLPLLVLVAIFCATVAGAAFINRKCVTVYGQAFSNFWNYCSLPACLETACVVLIFKDYVSKIKWSSKVRDAIGTVASCTLGIYLIHPVLTEKAFSFFTAHNMLWTIPLCTICIFAICFVLTALYKMVCRAVRIRAKTIPSGE